MAGILRMDILTRIVSILVIVIMIGSSMMTMVTPAVSGAPVSTSFEKDVNVTANLTTLAPTIVGPGTDYIGMVNITIFNNDTVADTFNWLNVTVLNYTDVDSVTLWRESDGNGAFTTLGDTESGTETPALFSGDLGFVNFTGLSQGVGAMKNLSYYIAFNTSVSAVNNNLINASVAMYNMNMSNAGMGGLITLYPDYSTVIDSQAPTIVRITTTDPNGDGKVENATIVLSEAVDDSTLDATLFTIGGVACSSISTMGTPNDNIIEVALAAGLTGTEVKDVTYTYGAGKTTDLYGNELASVSSGAISEFDGAPPAITDAITADSNGNGKIDRYVLSFSEDIAAYSNFYTEINVAGYVVDSENSTQSGNAEITLVLVEGLDFDTGATPDITFPSGKGSLADRSSPLPIDIASGDLNNDTISDLAVLNARSETISVFIQNGEDNFGMRTDYPAGINHGNVTVGDVNNDGFNDVVATNYDTGELLVFTYNQSSGKLNNYVSYTAGNGSLGLSIGDVNDDERNDVVVANYLDDEIAVFIQDASGTLKSPTRYSTGNGPTDVVVADITKTESYGNVLYDVVVTNYLDNTITPFRQTTGNVLTTLTSIATGTGPVGISAGDTNDDGWTDIVVANMGANTVSVFQQFTSTWTNTYLTAGSRFDYSTDPYPTDIDVADANTNGLNDIIVTNRGNDTVSFLLQSGTGTFSLGWKKTLSNAPFGITMGDFNIDGKYDAVTTQPDGNLITILEQEIGIYEFDNREDIYLGSSVRDYDPTSVDTGDVNNDGINDIVVADYLVARISVFLGTPGGRFQNKIDYSTIDTTWYEPWDVKIGDLNNDGLNDVAVTLVNDNRIGIFYQNVSGVLNDPVFNTTGTTPRRLAIGDLNNDGLNDVAVTNDNSNTVSVFTQNSVTGQLNPKVDYATGLIDPWGVAIGDVNNDGKNDVVVTHNQWNQYYHMSRLRQNAGGTLSAAETFQYINDRWMYFYDVEIADLNSDGKNDIIAGRQNTNQMGVWYQNVANTFGLATTYLTTYSNLYDLEIADINYDTKDDVVFISYNSYYAQIWGQSPSNVIQNWGSYRVDTNPYGLSVDDLDRDGYLDIVTANYQGSTDGSITILTQNPTTLEYDLAILNSTTDYPYNIAKGDANSDGLLDIAVPNQNSPYYMGVHYQDASGVFTSVKQHSINSYSYSTAIGDVNNDGRNDVVAGGYGWINVYTQKTDGTLNSYQYYSGYREAWDIAIGDINNDSLNDVVVSGRYRMMVYTQTVSGSLNSYAGYFPSNSYSYGVEIVDLNNDSLNDVAMSDSNNDRLIYYLQQSTGGLSTTANYVSTGDRPIGLVAGDFNNDGLTDLATANYNVNTISIITQKSSGGFNTNQDYATGSSPWGADTADFNGDGLDDVITADVGTETVSVITQNINGLMNTKSSYSVYTNPYYVRVGDFDNDTKLEFVTSHPGYDYIHTLNPEKRQGNDSSVMNLNLGMNSLQEVSSGDVIEEDGASPIYADALTGNLTSGNSSANDKIMARFSEDLDESTLGSIDFTVTGSVTVNTVFETSPGNVVLNVTGLTSDMTPTVSLVGSVKDANNLAVPIKSHNAWDGLRPSVISAVTADLDLDGHIDRYVLTFDEVLIGTGNGTGFTVEGYTIDYDNSSQTGPKEITLWLVEKTIFDTGLMPNITYAPGDLRDSIGNYLGDAADLTESDGSPPALASIYVYQIYENHMNLYSPNNTTLIYNNTASGLDATFSLRIEASDNGRLGYARGEDAFGNTSVMDTSENSGGTQWEYALNYTINQYEIKSPSLTVTVYDLDDNNATDSISLILDITAPSTSISTPVGTDFVAPFMPVTLTTSDPSGIYLTRYKVDGGSWNIYTGPFTMGSYGVGPHVIRFYSIDMVNNTEGEKVQNIYVTNDWTGGVPAFGTYSDMVILGCNLTISGKLVFENVTLIINSTSTVYPQWINVTNTGEFYLRNSTIFSVFDSYPSRFIMNGTLDMLNTTISDLWADPSTKVGGLEIYKSTAVIVNSFIYDAAGSGIFINGSSPTITGTTILDSPIGIVIWGGAPTITGNFFTNLTTSIMIANNTGAIIISGNSFSFVDYGIMGENLFYVDSQFTITQNTFMMINKRGIHLKSSYSASSILSIDNNTFENVMGGALVENMNGPPVYLIYNTIKNLTGINIGLGGKGNVKTYVKHNIFTNTNADVINIKGNTNEVVIAYNTVTGGSGTVFVHNVIGVHQGSGNIYIHQNTIIQVASIIAISTWDNANATVVRVWNNQLTDNGFGGIGFSEEANNIYVWNNFIENNNFGIYAEHRYLALTDTITITNNKVNNSTGAAITIDKINNIIIDNNLLYRSADRGVELTNTVWGTLTLNDNDFIENAGYGLYLADPSIDLGSSITNNSFIRNNNENRAIHTTFNPGTWNVYDQSVFIRNYPYFNGFAANIVLYDGSNMSFSSTRLDFFNDITIRSGGMFYAYDTIISGPSYYDFDVFGKIYLVSCTVENADEVLITDPEFVYMTATTFRWNSKAGIHLVNSNITLMNLFFVSNNNYGLHIEDSSPMIRRSQFRDNADHGVYGENFNGNITECEFLWNEADNLRLKDSSGMVYYNYIHDASDDNVYLLNSNTTLMKNAITSAGNYGIYLENSDAHILDSHKNYVYSVRYWGGSNYQCWINTNSNDAIYIYNSNPHIENNTLWNNYKNGISLVNSGGHIEYNEIAWHTNSGIGQFNPQSPSIHDNYLHDNGDSPPNRPPSATGGTILPYSPIFSSTLSITPVGWYDPDGDPPGFLYQWQKNVTGTWTNIGGATGSTLTGGIFGGDEIRCKLTPWDGKAAGPQVNSSSIVIGNSAPSITKVTLSPTPAYDNSAITAAPEGFSDPDFDTTQVFYYKWYVNGILLPNATSAFLTPGNFIANNTVYCKVIPSDGDLNGTEVQSSSVFVIHYTQPGQQMDDQDGDGVPDSQDAFPYDPTEWRDTDNDNIGDNTDSDIDGDGVNNTNDAFDFDNTETVDTDNDGIGDNADQDDDNDGYLDTQDAFPFNSTEWRDTDNDNIGDNTDTDIDGDGVSNLLDAFDYDKNEIKDSDTDGVGDNADQDDDNDGYIDAMDAFPFDVTEWKDTDGDGTGDNSDGDIDGDGVANAADKFKYDKDEWEDTDNDGIGNNKDPDDDGDGFYDINDAFPIDPSEHADNDKDNIGDNADDDDDNDGYLDSWEAELGSDNKSHASKPLDTDGDGKPDGDSTNSKAWMDTDDDDDGFSDSAEITAGTDPLDKDSYPGAPNRAPSITKVTITPIPAYDNSILSAAPEGFNDPDGDTTQVYYYKWYVNGVLVPGQTSAFIIPGKFKANDTVYTVVTPSDGEDNGTSLKSNVVLIIHFTEPGQEPKDYDGDGVPNEQDAFPYDPDEWHDTDGDGTGDNSDNDIDGDGILNGEDEFDYDRTETKDNDGDGIGDNADQDDDDDGALDLNDDFPFDNSEWRDTDGDGIGDNTDTDIDGDGVNNTLDEFDYDKGETRDSDGDGIGDNTDSDIDGDGITNSQDDFPMDPNEWNDRDGDGQGDNSDNDRDGDGIDNDLDLFPDNGNDWKDSDGDGQGDNADPDDDNDGRPDTHDEFPNDPDEDRDLDGDGLGDDADKDRDGDGIDNDFDLFPDNDNEWSDTDKDGVGDNTDPDIDGDNVTNSIDAFPYDKGETMDTDGDGLGDNVDPDIDGDNVANDKDKFIFDPDEYEDTDGDGIGNNMDSDDDNDDVPDITDAYPTDPSKSEKTTVDTAVDEKSAAEEDAGLDMGMVALIAVMIVIMLIMVFMYMKLNSQMNSGAFDIAPEERTQQRSGGAAPRKPGAEQPMKPITRKPMPRKPAGGGDAPPNNMQPRQKENGGAPGRQNGPGARPRPRPKPRRKN